MSDYINEAINQYVEDNDAWICMKAKCSNCESPELFVVCPMSVLLDQLQCGDCKETALKPKRMMFVIGESFKTQNGSDMIESLVYQTERNADQDV